MTTGWSDWKHYPRVARGETIEAPIGPGIFEVRHAASGALFAFDAADSSFRRWPNSTPKSLVSWFGKRAPVNLPGLEYRTLSTTTPANARIAAARMIDRRETYLRGAA